MIKEVFADKKQLKALRKEIYKNGYQLKNNTYLDAESNTVIIDFEIISKSGQKTRFSIHNDILHNSCQCIFEYHFDTKEHIYYSDTVIIEDC